MENQEDFYLVLPSNSSMLYAPENTTSCFTTHLGREMRLTGDWSVGLAEIHIPCTIMHFQEDEASFNFFEKNVEIGNGMGAAYNAYTFPLGVYETIEQVAEAINNSGDISKHQRLVPSKLKKGFYMLKRTCGCEQQHKTVLNEKIMRVFGFEAGIERGEPGDFIPGDTFTTEKKWRDYDVANRPASLARAIPDQLYVYTDVCVPYTVGYAQSSLLRIVTLDGRKYKYGSNIVKQFSPVLYIPLLHHSIQSLVVDIRDQHGERIPFEYGTLTVTLHFKRIR